MDLASGDQPTGEVLRQQLQTADHFQFLELGRVHWCRLVCCLRVKLCLMISDAHHLAANSSMYLLMPSNSAFPVEIKYRICVRSETFLLRSNSPRACCIGSSRVCLGILYSARTIDRHSEMTRCLWRKCSRLSAALLALPARVLRAALLKDMAASNRDVGRIEVVGVQVRIAYSGTSLLGIWMMSTSALILGEIKFWQNEAVRTSRVFRVAPRRS